MGYMKSDIFKQILNIFKQKTFLKETLFVDANIAPVQYVAVVSLQIWKIYLIDKILNIRNLHSNAINITDLKFL